MEGTTLLMVSAEELKQIIQDAVRDVIEQTKVETLASKEEATMSREEVETALKVCKQTLWRWEKQGYLVPKRAGKRLLYFKSDIERLLQKGV